jgi:hypothetical protein
MHAPQGRILPFQNRIKNNPLVFIASAIIVFPTFNAIENEIA